MGLEKNSGLEVAYQYLLPISKLNERLADLGVKEGRNSSFYDIAAWNIRNLTTDIVAHLGKGQTLLYWGYSLPHYPEVMWVFKEALLLPEPKVIELGSESVAYEEIHRGQKFTYTRIPDVWLHEIVGPNPENSHFALVGAATQDFLKEDSRISVK